MSTDQDQTDLGEFSSAGESDDRGVPLAERVGRDACGAERADGGNCQSPVFPGYNRCWRHIGDDGPDYSHQFAIATASEDDAEVIDETRCPECNAPVASMYLVGGEFHQCPKCGHSEV